MATVFDRGSLWLLSMMRRYAAVRLVLLLYVVWLQLWALFMLDWAMDMEQECAHTPSVLLRMYLHEPADVSAAIS